MTSYETSTGPTSMHTKGATGYSGRPAYGKLILTLKSAHQLNDKAWFGKSDPRCEVRLADAEISTHAVKNAGESCTWDESFAFSNVSPDDEIIFKVYDKNILKDTFMGEGSLSLRQVFEDNQMDTRVPLTNRAGTKGAGEIWVNMRMEGVGGGAGAGMTGYERGMEREMEGTTGYAGTTGYTGTEKMGRTTEYETSTERTTREGEVCGQEFFTKTEDRPIVKERVVRVVEHHPVEKEFVTETRATGRESLHTGTVESLGTTERVVSEAAPRSPCD